MDITQVLCLKHWATAAPYTACLLANIICRVH